MDDITEVNINDAFSLCIIHRTILLNNTPPNEIQKEDPKILPLIRLPIMTLMTFTIIIYLTPNTCIVTKAMIFAKPILNTPNIGGIVAVSIRFNVIAIALSKARYVNLFVLLFIG